MSTIAVSRATWRGRYKTLTFGLGIVVALLIALPFAANPAQADATFTVNRTGNESDANQGDGVCDALASLRGNQCSLRAAIQEGNATAGDDTIEFEIPDNPNIAGLEVKTITPTSLLPTITDTVTIDGYSQTGAIPNGASTNANSAVLKIQLSGANASANAFGLAVSGAGAAGTTIKGLVINRFGDDGVFVNANDAVIEGNFIGTNAAGTSDLGNFSDGVHLEGNVSESEVADNTISGNGSGVEIFGAGASGNTVSSNFIGTNGTGDAGLGNSGFGVFINAPDNVIGSTVSGGGNTIAFNGQDGVVIAGGGATGNRILRNAIFSNGGLGIDLIGGTENANGATANDPDDTDTGPNTLQNKPVLNSFSGLTIEGNLNSTPNRTFVIQFFANPQGENEGRFFLGQESVTTNANGNANFTFTAPAVPEGTQNVTATATRAGNTSEFSAARPAE